LVRIASVDRADLSGKSAEKPLATWLPYLLLLLLLLLRSILILSSLMYLLIVLGLLVSSLGRVHLGTWMLADALVSLIWL
jgi:hypothetical protein